MSGDRAKPLPFWRASRAVFDLSLETTLWSRRALVMGVLLGLPVVFALLYRGVLLARLPAQIAPLDLYQVVVSYFYVRLVLPLVALYAATALVADEADGKTLTYLFTRPITRGSILAGKFAAFVLSLLSLSLPPALVTFLLLATARGMAGVGLVVPGLFRDLGVMSLAVLAYGGLFTLFGVLFRRPLIPGLLFLFVWEWLAGLPGYLPRLTVTAWLRSLLGHAPAARGLGSTVQVLPADLSLVVLLAVTVASLALAAFVFSRREYALGQ